MNDKQKVRKVTIPVAGGGEIILKDVDIAVEASARMLARHGVNAFAVHANSATRPVFQKLGEVSAFMQRLMSNRFNYGLDFTDFAYYHRQMDIMAGAMDEVQVYYRDYSKQAKEIKDSEGSNNGN